MLSMGPPFVLWRKLEMVFRIVGEPSSRNLSITTSSASLHRGFWSLCSPSSPNNSDARNPLLAASRMAEFVAIGVFDTSWPIEDVVRWTRSQQIPLPTGWSWIPTWIQTIGIPIEFKTLYMRQGHGAMQDGTSLRVWHTRLDFTGDCCPTSKTTGDVPSHYVSFLLSLCRSLGQIVFSQTKWPTHNE